jgi:nucleoside 2-deoxyribosyltransferase
MLPTLGAGQRSNERLEEALSQSPTRFCSNERSYQDEQPAFCQNSPAVAVVPKTEFEQFEDPHSKQIRNKTVVLADVCD